MRRAFFVFLLYVLDILDNGREYKMEKRVSLSIIDFQKKLGHKAAIDAAKRCNADAIDFDLSPRSVTREGDIYSRGKEAVREYYLDLKEHADALGIKIHQTHGRFNGYGITPEEDEIFLKNAELDCIATAALGAKYTVFHTPAYNHVGDLPDEQMMRIGTSLFSAILPFAKENGIKIAAETHGTASKYGKMEFFGIPENLLALINEVKSASDAGEHLCVCVDTGHTNLGVKMGYPSVANVIRQLGSLVEVLHMHDNNGIKDQHKMPKTGILDWEDILAALDEIGYEGCYNLEVVLDHFGVELMEDEGAFSVKIMKNMLK